MVKTGEFFERSFNLKKHKKSSINYFLRLKNSATGCKNSRHFHLQNGKTRSKSKSKIEFKIYVEN